MSELSKPNVAFICVHNSCRSQIAEALAKKYAPHIFSAYSAGTEVKSAINSDAVQIVKELYGVDMTQDQYSKLIQDLPKIDIVVTMGCNVSCPYLPCKHREDWGLSDPTGMGREVFVDTITEIEHKVVDLKRRIQDGLLDGKEGK